VQSSNRRHFFYTLGGAAAISAVPSRAETKSSRDKPLAIGLVGCGGRGKYLGRELLAVRTAGCPLELKAVCDIYRPRLESAAAAFQAKAFSTAAEMLSDGGLDGVIIATPDRTHVPLALDAVRAGKDVYCEKPVSHWSQFDLLKEFVAEVRKRNSIVQVGAQWVSDPIWSEAATQIKQGAIGKVVHAQTGYFRHGDEGERGMPIEDPNAQPGRGLDWGAFQGDGKTREFTVSRFFQWRMYLDYAGGPIMDLYPHPLTRLLKALSVGMPRRVVAVGGRFLYDGGRDVPDTADVLIEYPDGPDVSVLGTLGNSEGLDTIIRGSQGTVTFDKSFGMTFAPMPDGKGAALTLNSQEYVQNHLRDWLECIRTRQAPKCDIELAYIVQVPLIMAMRSLLESRVAIWDSSKEEIRLV
jgi:predicted dehydrogenase